MGDARLRILAQVRLDLVLTERLVDLPVVARVDELAIAPLCGAGTGAEL